MVDGVDGMRTPVGLGTWANGHRGPLFGGEIDRNRATAVQYRNEARPKAQLACASTAAVALLAPKVTISSKKIKIPKISACTSNHVLSSFYVSPLSLLARNRS